jgi:hypothetical protein
VGFFRVNHVYICSAWTYSDVASFLIGNASSSVTFAKSLFSQTPLFIPLETGDQFYTHLTTMLSLSAQNRGTKRPPSDPSRLRSL